MPMFDQKDSLKITGDVKWSAEIKDPIVADVRKRYGGVIVRLDFNKDGKTDLLLLSAAIRNGKLCDVLLRNDGDHFTDVSSVMGLPDSGSLGAAVGDYNNDGWPDLALTTTTGVRLFKNDAGKKWVDQTAEAGFGKLTGPYLCAAWIDLDQDGDLDLILTSYGDQATLSVLQNAGVAAPSRADEPVPALTTAFQAVTIPNLAASGKIRGLLATDIDGDKDVDLVILFEDKAPLVILNDRLMRFHVGEPLPVDAATNGLILDANGDDQSDLFFLTNDKPLLITSQTDRQGGAFKERFAKGATDAPPLVQAQWCDLDFDGRSDLVGLSREGKAVFLHGDGLGKLSNVAEPFGPAVGELKGLLSVAVTDLNGDCHPDLFVWTAEGPKLFTGQSNGNRGLRVLLTGKRDSNNAGAGQKNLRTNTDGIGTKIQTLTGPLQTTVEMTTLSSGPGQSLVPVEVGIGRATKCDALRIRWPDCVVQAELDLATCELVTIGEINRKPTSCPIIMTWDGEKWVYVTDCLGGSALGESGVDGSTHLPRTGESVKIESSQLGLKNGQYVLRIAEPMDEVMYLDRVQLLAIDHPVGSLVYPDERFAVADPQPTEKPQLFRQRAVPFRAVDHRGVDWTAAIASHDGKTVEGFSQRSWLGFAEEHWLELDFGKTLQTLPQGQPLTLALAGWTDYPYPESILAASQAGVEMAPPVLERKTSNGNWEKVADLGFPAGLPKVMTVPLPESIRKGGSVFRIRTNLQIYWDHVFVSVAEMPKSIATMPVAHAELSSPGFVRELKAGPTQPQRYDPNDFERVAVSTWSGKLTKLGNVTELLTWQDDRFVLCGPGDEVTISFDAKLLPPVPAGQVRSFILKVEGYCKDTAPTTQTGGQIDPLPYRAMKNYPPKDTAPASEARDKAEWHTRPHMPKKER
ncbi:MAG: VCBS repeat-containing protein [Gemmataceae bacterium]